MAAAQLLGRSLFVTQRGANFKNNNFRGNTDKDRKRERERERERESVYPSENKELMLLTNLRIAYICYAERMDSGWMLRVT